MSETAQTNSPLEQQESRPAGGTYLDATGILELWNQWAESHESMTRCWNFFKGKQAILDRSPMRKDGGKAARIVTNWIRFIVRQHVGFLTSDPISFTLRDAKEDDPRNEALTFYADVRDANRLNAQDSRLLRNCIIFGLGVEVHGFANDAPRIRCEDPRNWAFLWDDKEELAVAVRRKNFEVGDFYKGEVLKEPLEVWTYYDRRFVMEFEVSGEAVKRGRSGRRGQSGRSGQRRAEDMIQTKIIEHCAGGIPVIAYRINDEYESLLTDDLLEQQNAYNRTRSDNNDDVAYNVDQFLVVKGYSLQELLNAIEQIREQRSIPLDEDGEAKFIEKGNSVEKVKYELELARDAIHVMGGVPDLHAIVGASGQVSGIALKLKFSVQQQVSEGFCREFEGGLRRRVDLLNHVRRALGQSTLERYDITISKNIPVNDKEMLESVPFMRMIMPTEEILSQIPFVQDPRTTAAAKEAEMKKLKSQGIELDWAYPPRGKEKEA